MKNFGYLEIIFCCLTPVVYSIIAYLKLSSINPGFFKAASSLRNALRYSGRYPLSNANIRNTKAVFKQLTFSCRTLENIITVTMFYQLIILCRIETIVLTCVSVSTVTDIISLCNKYTRCPKFDTITVRWNARPTF